jgi:CxxC-x17-CxxC domain-containing protein
LSLAEKTLTCRECGADFIFSVGEQEFYAEKGLLNEPQRCPDCRAQRRRQRSGGENREMHEVVCAGCGGPALVPFLPRNERPVYCSTCFAERNSVGAR